MAVQPKEAVNAHTRAPTKTKPDMDLTIRKRVKVQELPDDPEKSIAEISHPTTDVVNGILEGIGVMSDITELRRLGIFNSDRRKPGTLMLTLST